ncbi:MAG: hypothetical protein U9O96_00650, partial [Candidatus Thermoplasmatota archaeon]|nr:hypothetical protein [Candidatus Thermoplasmatota archaeon]
GFLRACARIGLNATDYPDNQCKVGVSGIYWRYEYQGEEYPYESGVLGGNIPGITEEDEEIYSYYWYIYDEEEGIHLPEDCIHEFYYFAKDYLCHTSKLHHERWYVDGTAPETDLNISWGDHPWIPKNDGDSSANEEDYWYKPWDTLPTVICKKDDFHFYANHTRNGTEPCIYPYNWQDNTFFRWRWWNPDTEKYEFWPTPETEGAINGSDITVSDYESYINWTNSSLFWIDKCMPQEDWEANWSQYVENYYGGYIWWMPYAYPGEEFFDHGCNHTLYYFSKDDLCNTEQPNEWYVGVDDMAPQTELVFDGINFTAGDNLYYIRDDTDVCLNASDYPENEDCQTGVQYLEYTLWFWQTSEYEVRLLSNQIGGLMYWDPHFGVLFDPVTNDEIGWYYDAIDPDGDGNWSSGDYMYIEWDVDCRNDGYYSVESIVKDGSTYLLIIRDVTVNAVGEWIPLIEWTRYCGDYICLGDWFDECGKYELHYYAVDYNNWSEEIHVPDIIVDCTPPISIKEYGEPVQVIQEEVGETVHTVNATTPICFSAVDPHIWDSGVKHIQYKFESTGIGDPSLYEWKTFENVSEGKKYCFTLIDHFGQDFLDSWYETYNTSKPFILYHRAIDNVSHYEEYLPTKQKIYYNPLLNETAPTIEKGYLQPSIKSSIIEDMDYVTSDTPIWLYATDNQSGLVRIEVSLTGAPFPGEWWVVWAGGPVAEYTATFTVTEFEAGMGITLNEGEVYHLFYRASDNAGLVSDEGKQKIIIDNTPPQSTIDTIEYEQNYTEPFDINVTANDQFDEVGVSSVTLYYRYSEDNETWGDWIEYGTQTAGFTWSFNAPEGPGYYQFCSVATDGLGNVDDVLIPKAECYVEPVSGDFDGDGSVDIVDLMQIVQYWGMSQAENPEEWETLGLDKYDLGGPGGEPDGVIDLFDLTILASNWTG